MDIVDECDEAFLFTRDVSGIFMHAASRAMLDTLYLTCCVIVMLANQDYSALLVTIDLGLTVDISEHRFELHDAFCWCILNDKLMFFMHLC
jgi:hypothetical protein